MRVYIVVDMYDGDKTIEKVFSSREKAEKWVESQDPGARKYCDIFEYEVDEGDEK